MIYLNTSHIHGLTLTKGLDMCSADSSWGAPVVTFHVQHTKRIATEAGECTGCQHISFIREQGKLSADANGEEECICMHWLVFLEHCISIPYGMIFQFWMVSTTVTEREPMFEYAKMTWVYMEHTPWGNLIKLYLLSCALDKGKPLIVIGSRIFKLIVK